MINWNEVTVGETEIINPKTRTRRLVKGREGGYVWAVQLCGDEKGQYLSWKEYAYDNWTIYDPWEEITEECEWAQMAWNHIGWVIRYKGSPIECFNPNFKSNGRRAWKRKEGYG